MAEVGFAPNVDISKLDDLVSWMRRRGVRELDVAGIHIVCGDEPAASVATTIPAPANTNAAHPFDARSWATRAAGGFVPALPKPEGP